MLDNREYGHAKVFDLDFSGANFFAQKNLLSLGHSVKIVDPVHFLELGTMDFRAFAFEGGNKTDDKVI